MFGESDAPPARRCTLRATVRHERLSNDDRITQICVVGFIFYIFFQRQLNMTLNDNNNNNTNRSLKGGNDTWGSNITAWWFVFVYVGGEQTGGGQQGFGFPDWDKVWQMGDWKLGSLAAAAPKKDVKRCRLLGHRSKTNPLWQHLFCQNVQNRLLVPGFVCRYFFFLPCTVLSFPVSHLTVNKNSHNHQTPKKTITQQNPLWFQVLCHCCQTGPSVQGKSRTQAFESPRKIILSKLYVLKHFRTHTSMHTNTRTSVH